MPAWTAVDRVSIAQPHRARITRQALQRRDRRGSLFMGAGRIADGLFELGPPFGVALDEFAALLVLDDLGSLGHQRSSRNSTWRRITGSYLRSTIRSGSLRR